MRFHSLQFQIKGNAQDGIASDGQDLDIADEFARLSRSLGFEGAPDSYAGLWATQFVYNDYSLLEGDFLARGLCLDLLCDSDSPIPISAIFLCLGETLKRTARCTVTELTVVCEPYSVRTKIPKGNGKANLERFIAQNREINPLPIAQCATVKYACKGKQASVLASGEVPLLMSRCYFPELALPFSGICSQWGTEILRHAETIEITAS
ncbi:MAG: hypothetical protein KIA12_09280 [Varibaculum cambriense]|uniref:hypothetical protein n=1 Tax=Varibaculum cambriense TaxID=184870 RepID=UPI00241E66A8|nr:hypothetical protein [Varibaculum cambriense]MBS5973664.1 hypothetical protein [Varibaculum cambriense]